jgi:hypothetical protein
VTAITTSSTSSDASFARPNAGVPRRAGPGLYGVKAVGSFVPRLTAKAFEKFGFSTASLITDWPAIAGKELAAYTAPERLKWPRNADVSDDEEASSRQSRRGATLVLRVDAGRALDVQYKARQITERINAYFGYAAIAELRIVQAPIARSAAAAPRAVPAVLAPFLAEVQGIADPALRQALSRLGAGVRAGR